MLEVYKSDIEGFGKEDWEDMLENPRVPVGMRSAWEDWRDGKRCEFEVGDYDCLWHEKEWKGFPLKEFAFCMEQEGEKVEYSEELESLLGDIVRLGEAKQCLYHPSMLLDCDLEAEMDSVSDHFGAAYDKALARALAMLLKELMRARG